MFGSPPLNGPIDFKGVKVMPKPMSHSQILLMPQTVPCPRCQIGVTILELVHRAPDGIVTCCRGHRFPVTQVAQYFGRIDNIGTAEDVEKQVRAWLDRPEPPAPAFSFTVFWVIAAAAGGIFVGVLLGLLIVYGLRGPAVPASLLHP